MQAEYAIISGCAEQATWRLYYIALRNMPGTTGSGVIGDWVIPWYPTGCTASHFCCCNVPRGILMKSIKTNSDGTGD